LIYPKSRELKKNLAFKFVAKIKKGLTLLRSGRWVSLKKMSITLTRNKSFSSNYSTLKQKFEKDLKNYYSSIEILRRLLTDGDDFNFLAKILHPLKDFLALQDDLKEDLHFWEWALKN
jgi:hypothetical protein